MLIHNNMVDTVGPSPCRLSVRIPAPAGRLGGHALWKSICTPPRRAPDGSGLGPCGGPVWGALDSGRHHVRESPHDRGCGVPGQDRLGVVTWHQRLQHPTLEMHQGGNPVSPGANLPRSCSRFVLDGQGRYPSRWSGRVGPAKNVVRCPTGIVLG